MIIYYGKKMRKRGMKRTNMNQQSKRNLTNKIISLAGIMVFVFL